MEILPTITCTKGKPSGKQPQHLQAEVLHL